jgi:hypothetical protein
MWKTQACSPMHYQCDVWIVSFSRYDFWAVQRCSRQVLRNPSGPTARSHWDVYVLGINAIYAVLHRCSQQRFWADRPSPISARSPWQPAGPFTASKPMADARARPIPVRLDLRSNTYTESPQIHDGLTSPSPLSCLSGSQVSKLGKLKYRLGLTGRVKPSLIWSRSQTGDQH